jgi:hypothetical protein
MPIASASPACALSRASRNETDQFPFADGVRNPAVSFARALRGALPPLHIALTGSLLWCAAISACVWLNARFAAWEMTAQRVEVLQVMAAGAFLGFAPGVTLANLIAGRKRQSQHMAALLIGLTLSTLGFTALVYLFQYRAYYSIWHDSIGSNDWYWQQFFTTAAAVYQFAVLGTRLYLPFGPPLLIGAAYILSRKRL